MVEAQHDQAERRYPHVFRPIRGRHAQPRPPPGRAPHGGGNGSLLGTEADFEQHAALWLAKLAGGMRWLGGGPELRPQPAAARLRADRRGVARPGLLPRSALSGTHRRAGRPCACRWRSALGADGPAGRHAHRAVGHAVELRRPPHPPPVRPRRGALAGPGVRRVGRHRDRRRRRRHRDPRQPRRRGAVVPLAADQPPRRRVRRHRRAATPVPPRGRRVDPCRTSRARSPSACGSASTR